MFLSFEVIILKSHNVQDQNSSSTLPLIIQYILKLYIHPHTYYILKLIE